EAARGRHAPSPTPPSTQGQAWHPLRRTVSKKAEQIASAAEVRLWSSADASGSARDELGGQAWAVGATLCGANDRTDRGQVTSGRGSLFGVRSSNSANTHAPSPSAMQEVSLTSSPSRRDSSFSSKRHTALLRRATLWNTQLTALRPPESASAGPA